MNDFIMLLSATVLMGLGSSLHCAAMCGPLACIASQNASMGAGQSRSRFALYFSGKTSGYIIVGTTIFLLGGFFNLSWLHQWAHFLALVALVGTLLYLLYPGIFSKFSTGLLSKFSLAPSIARNLQGLSHHIFYPFFLGALSALLPCGLLIAMYGMVLAAGTTLNAVILMLAFALSTVPVLLVSVFLGQTLLHKIKSSSVKKALAFVMVAVAFYSINLRLNHNHGNIKSSEHQHGHNHHK